MKVWMLLKIAVQSLRANKMRSLLTMLGIIIGVAAVIAMVSIGDGAQANVSRRIKSMGTNLLIVRPGQRRNRYVRSGSTTTLTVEDADAIRKTIPNIAAVSPEVSKSFQLKYMSQNASTTVLGATADYLKVNAFKIADGRFFTEYEAKTSRKYVVIGATVAKNLFNGNVPMGQDLKVGGMNFTIIGVLEAKGQSGYRDPDDQVLIPLQTAQRRLFGIKHLRAINIQVSHQKHMETVQAAIERLLRHRHRIRSGQESDFNIRNQKDPGNHELCHRNLHHLTGLHRCCVDVGRRHWNHEHHVGLRDRTYPRDRHPKSSRSDLQRYPFTVLGGVHLALLSGGPHRHRDGCRSLHTDLFDGFMEYTAFDESHRGLLCFRCSHRHFLRNLPGPASRKAQPD